MQPDDLGSAAPGHLVSYGREYYYKPDPLPPDGGLDLDDDFYENLSDATYWLGRLSGITQTVDFPPVLYTSLLRKEAIESAEIEGADVDFNALYSVETSADRSSGGQSRRQRTSGEDTKDTTEVLNYEEAVRSGIEAIDRGDPVTLDLLHSLHDTLLTGVPADRVDTDTIGAFKTAPNHIGDFLPPVPGVVEGLMQALITYYRTGGSYHRIVDFALFHYQFETIHPFGDGNGRLGRLLVTLQLYENGYLERPNLYLSEFFNRNKQAYVDRLTAVRTEGEWEKWVSFFVDAVRNQARESVERTLELKALREAYEREYGNVAFTAPRLACSLFEQPYVTADTVAERFDVGRSTAYRAIDDLVEDGVLEEVTGQGRNQEFRAREIFDILEQPPQTY